jgi:hypothetical protein
MRRHHIALLLTVWLGALPAQDSRPAATAADPVTTLVEELKRGPAEKREAAVEKLVPLLAANTAAVLPVLGDADAEVRAAALRAFLLGRRPLPPETLGPLLRDDSEAVRETAVLLLVRTRPKDLVTEFTLLLNREGSQRVLRHMLVGLGGCKDLAAVPVMLDWMRLHEEKYLREKAAGALQSLTGQTFGQDLAAWDAWWEANGQDLLRKQREREAVEAGELPASRPKPEGN